MVVVVRGDGGWIREIGGDRIACLDGAEHRTRTIGGVVQGKRRNRRECRMRERDGVRAGRVESWCDPLDGSIQGLVDGVCVGWGKREAVGRWEGRGEAKEALSFCLAQFSTGPGPPKTAAAAACRDHPPPTTHHPRFQCCTAAAAPATGRASLARFACGTPSIPCDSQGWVPGWPALPGASRVLAVRYYTSYKAMLPDAHGDYFHPPHRLIRASQPPIEEPYCGEHCSSSAQAIGKRNGRSWVGAAACPTCLLIDSSTKSTAPPTSVGCPPVHPELGAHQALPTGS